MSYQRNQGGGGWGRGPGNVQMQFGGPLTPVVKYFIITNVVVFLFMSLLRQPSLSEIMSGTTEGFNQHTFRLWFGLVPAWFWGKGAIWQLVTFNFVHSNVWHIFFNLFALWMFGGELEKLFGRRRFIIFIAISGIGAGLSMVLTSPSMAIPVVGASGIVYGILLAYGVTYPERTILFMFFIPMKVKHFVILMGVFELYFTISGTSSGVAHLAHLGGMFFGGIYLYWDRIYMKLRQKYYRRKLDHLKKQFTVIKNDDKDDNEPTFH